MTVHQIPSSMSRNAPRNWVLDDICDFITRNADDLIWVATTTGGHNGHAAASDLVDAAMCGPAMEEDIQDLLVVVRDFLHFPSDPTFTVQSVGRPDLDAAIRWMGARLDDQIRRYA